MKKLLPIFLLVLTIAAFNSSCKKAEVVGELPPNSITMGVNGSGTCSYNPNAEQYDSNQVFTLQLSERDTLTIEGITTNGGYILTVSMTDSVQYISHNGMNTPQRLLLNTVVDNNSAWQYYSPSVVLSAFSNNTPVFGSWQDGQPGYLPFRVHKVDNKWYYGWIQLRANGVNGFTVLSWFFYV